MHCLCGSNLGFENCCNQYISGAALAPTAEKLMRSRYTAFNLKNAQYLLDTWHPSKRPKELDLENDQTQWISLTIVSTDKGLENDYDGMVEFIAEFESNGQKSQLHEKSKFVKKNGTWLYRDGKIIQK